MVCKRWDSFSNFLKDMGMRPEATTLDRIDSNGDYEPGNCRWATGRQQASNKRDVSALSMIEFQGKTLTINAWSVDLCLGKNTIARRLQSGWSVEDALTKPPRSKQPNARSVRAA